VKTGSGSGTYAAEARRRAEGLWPKDGEASGSGYESSSSGSGYGGYENVNDQAGRIPRGDTYNSYTYDERASYEETIAYERKARNFESMNNDLDGISMTIDKVKTSNKLILDHIMSQDTAIGNLESQRTSLASHIRHIYAVVDELEAELSISEAENAGMRKQISAMDAQIAAYEAENESMSQEIASQNHKIAELEGNLQESQQNYSDLKYENNELLERIEVLEAKAKELQRKEELLDWARKELIQAQQKDSELRQSFAEIQAVLSNRDHFDRAAKHPHHAHTEL